MALTYIFKEAIRKIAHYLVLCTKPISYIAAYTGIYSILRHFKRNKTLILAYHGVSKDNITSLENFDGKHVNKNLFEKQLHYLKKNYNIISLDQYVKSQKLSVKLPKKSLVITFDDGYKNNYTILQSLIRKYDIPVTIFLPIEQIGMKNVPWQSLIAFCIAKTKEKSLRIEINGRKQTYDLSNNKNKLSSLIRVRNKLVKSDNPSRDSTVKEILKQCKVRIGKKDDNLYIMSWPEVKKLRDVFRGQISFGSHAMSHSSLTSLSDAQVKKEMKQSKRVLERKLNTKINNFSYPFGEFNNKITHLCKHSGYSSAVTTDYGYNKDINKNINKSNDKNADLFRLKRIAVSNNNDMALFMLSLFVNLGKVVSSISRIYLRLKKYKTTRLN